jgi:uncharacterized protein YlxW (UPF0749 family)
MSRPGSILHLTFVFFVLGVLIVVQLRTTSRAATTSLTPSDQTRVLANLVESNAALRDEIVELEATLARLNPADRAASDAALAAELARLLVISGRVEVSGPGVRLEISGQINPLDMQDLINELRNAGAEAIAVDRHRVIVRSVVSRNGPDLSIDGWRLTPPYVIEAIGQPDTMQTALLRRGGLVGLLEYAYPGLKITIEKRDNLILPAYSGHDEPKLAAPLQTSGSR